MCKNRITINVKKKRKPAKLKTTFLENSNRTNILGTGDRYCEKNINKNTLMYFETEKAKVPFNSKLVIQKL